MSPGADHVIRRLDGTRQKWWFFTFLTTASLAVSGSLATLLALMLSDALFVFKQWTLIGLFVAWLAVTISFAVLVVRRMVRNDRSIEATARRVQEEFPELGSNLINIVQLSDDKANPNRAFCERAVLEAVSKVGSVPLEDAARRESRWRRFRFCMQTPRDFVESLGVLGLLVFVAIVCHLAFPTWGSAANRLLSPWEFKPSVGKVQIVKVTPGNAEVMAGASLDISAEISSPEKKVYKAVLYVTPKGDTETPISMTTDDKMAVYKALMPSIVKPFGYRLEIGDSQSEIYQVAIREKPTVQKTEVTYHFPEYLGRRPEKAALQTPDLDAPQFTVAELRIVPSTPIAKGYVEADGKRFTGSVSDEGNLFTVRVPMFRDSTYTINLQNSAGHSDASPRLNRIRVQPDAPPTVQLLKPARQSTAAPGSDVAVSVRATDDHAVARVRLEMKVVKPAAEDAQNKTPVEVIGPTLVQEWTKFEAKNANTLVLPHRLPLTGEHIKSGYTVLLRALAADNRLFTDYGQELKPQEAATDWHAVNLVAEEAKVAASVEQIDNVRNLLWKLLESQVNARVRTGLILRTDKLAERTGIADEVRGKQVDIQKSATALVAAVPKTDKEDLLTIKKVVNELATGDMLEAVRQCDALSKIKAVEGFDRPATAVGAIQERILEKLRKLLDVARKAHAETLGEAEKRMVGDLPPEKQKKFEELKAKLDEFLKKQKKVIEATTDLAKKPVEDFTEADEEALKGMAASMDDWNKFMKDFQSDLSKLPDQDFANASIAKELVEIQTELKMAEDALLKKSADIAVPLEQLGYEKAAELSTNMEKWLPDTPDREKWSQEEALTDADKEAPMAELPSELEDLIGDLMEGEEDLFDEMEDVSSSAIDSPDKGVGWDASDGPISSNSAKGVTGNRLPNTSEIGGRSGEGRSGKSSGEFVGDEAVGKGGRKTPSRLTPDPYMKGQIKDHSKDPTGGSTGGGKESGQGGEGLEGPAPRSPGQRDLGRLADKQAALRNKAEGVDVQMQVGNYHHTDLKKLIDLMESVETDLRAGRYQSALRQRTVMLEKAKNVKQYLDGEFQVKQDATSNLPKDIQKEILGSMTDPSPVGWEEINREYFERLAKGGAMDAEPPPPPAEKK